MGRSRSFRPFRAGTVTCLALLIALGGTSFSFGSAAVRAAPPTDAFSVESDEAIEVGTSRRTMLSLSVPDKGAYVLFAKAYFKAQQPDQHVTCSLVAGSNDDESKVDLGKLGYGNATTVLHVVHTFKAGGTATFRCISNTGNVNALYRRLTAIRVASITASRATTGLGPVSAGTRGATPTKTYSTYQDGPVAVASGQKLLAALTLETGNYVFWAKAYFRPTEREWGHQTITCRLAPARRLTEAYYDDESAVTFSGDHADALVAHLAIPLTHTDTVYFTCDNMYGGTTNASFVKVTAVRVDAIEVNSRRSDPPAATGETTPADVHSAYWDDRVYVAKSSMSPVAKLWIPQAGKYVLWAKTYLKTSFDDRPTTCMLKAGGADDETKVWLDDTKKHSDTLFTHVVWTFKKPNWATFSCKVPQPSTTVSVPAEAYWTKVTAMRVASITNTPYSG